MSWKIEEQLCFLLYANSRNVIKLYKKLLDPIGLTYTQYITMIALWEKDHQTVSELGGKLSLDSGTLTPLLKKLETDQRIKRHRDPEDERRVWIDLTDSGKKLSETAKKIPFELYQCVDLPESEAKVLFNVLSKLHESIKPECTPDSKEQDS
jgi:MarR family transcriptional regulator, organic hydroperoxide resistance regulator